MLIKDAIDLMARSPALKFPWVPSVVEVINAYLPPEHQITDVPNISVDLLNAALDQLSEESRTMVLASNVTLQPPPLTPVPPVVAVPTPPAAATAPAGDRRSGLYMLFGVTIVVMAVIAVSPLFGRLESGDLVQIIKILMDGLLSLSTGTNPSGGGQ